MTRIKDEIRSYSFLDPSLMNKCPNITLPGVVEQTREFFLTQTTPDQCASQEALSSSIIDTVDICLATVDEQSQQWQCVLSYTERQLTPVWIDAGLPPAQLTALISTCDNQVYAFAHMPLPSAPSSSGSGESLWQQWGRIVVISVCVVGAFLIIATYVVSRLVRYRRKYKENRAKREDLQEHVRELDETHGGLGVADEDVDMVANPMVLEMQELEEHLRKLDQSMGVQEARDELAMDKLEGERRRLYSEIERVKKAMSSVETKSPTAVVEANAAAAAAIAAPAVVSSAERHDFGATAQPLRRAKKEID